MAVRACGPACSVSCATCLRMSACCRAGLLGLWVGLLLFMSCIGAVWAPLQFHCLVAARLCVWSGGRVPFHAGLSVMCVAYMVPPGPWWLLV